MNEHHITVAGLFEPVAIALSTLRSVSVVESTESHVLATLASGTAVLARASKDDSSVRVTLLGADALRLAGRLADDLRRLLAYEVSGPR